jgi:hypothetical protein
MEEKVPVACSSWKLLNRRHRVALSRENARRKWIPRAIVGCPASAQQVNLTAIEPKTLLYILAYIWHTRTGKPRIYR